MNRYYCKIKVDRKYFGNRQNHLVGYNNNQKYDFEFSSDSLNNLVDIGDSLIKEPKTLEFFIIKKNKIKVHVIFNEWSTGEIQISLTDFDSSNYLKNH